MKTCSEKIKNMIRTVDFFGTFISFRVDQEIIHKSLIGGSCTIIYIIIAFIYIIYMAIPFLKRKEIDFTFSNKIVSNKYFEDYFLKDNYEKIYNNLHLKEINTKNYSLNFDQNKN